MSDDKEAVTPLSKEAEERLSIWFNNINLKIDLAKKIEEKDKEIDRLNNIIKNLDKMFEYYFLGNLKYDQDTVNTIYIKYVKLKELKENK